MFRNRSPAPLPNHSLVPSTNLCLQSSDISTQPTFVEISISAGLLSPDHPAITRRSVPLGSSSHSGKSSVPSPASKRVGLVAWRKQVASAGTLEREQLRQPLAHS